MIEFILSFIFLAWRMSCHITKAKDKLYDSYWENDYFLRVLRRLKLEEKYSIDVEMRVNRWLFNERRDKGL